VVVEEVEGELFPPLDDATMSRLTQWSLVPLEHTGLSAAHFWTHIEAKNCKPLI
jgi:hypothetical protein